MKVILQDKKELFPNFGKAEGGYAYVRNDLPAIVQTSVIAHELYHLKDTSRNVLWREIKANFVGMIHCPLGFFLCCIMSLAPYRLKFYVDRFKNKY